MKREFKCHVVSIGTPGLVGWDAMTYRFRLLIYVYVQHICEIANVIRYIIKIVSN